MAKAHDGGRGRPRTKPKVRYLKIKNFRKIDRPKVDRLCEMARTIGCDVNWNEKREETTIVLPQWLTVL